MPLNINIPALFRMTRRQSCSLAPAVREPVRQKNEEELEGPDPEERAEHRGPVGEEYTEGGSCPLT